MPIIPITRNMVTVIIAEGTPSARETISRVVAGAVAKLYL